MTKLFRKVFPYLLRLGCDVERVSYFAECEKSIQKFVSPFSFFHISSRLSQVAEQLFRPLVFQMIHWFTRNTQYESPDTMALLDAILVRQTLYCCLISCILLFWAGTYISIVNEYFV